MNLHKGQAPHIVSESAAYPKLRRNSLRLPASIEITFEPAFPATALAE
jgi:hypothetical protein